MTDMMIHPSLVKTLRIIHDRLQPENVEWVLVGSMGLALRGARIVPKDIDLMSDNKGAYRIEQLFQDSVTLPVSLKTSERIESHFGVMDMGGVKVEIMGDFRIRLQEGDWYGPPDFIRYKEVCQIEEMSIPVLSLEWEYDAYYRLGRHDRAEMVKELIISTGRRD